MANSENQEEVKTTTETTTVSVTKETEGSKVTTETYAPTDSKEKNISDIDDGFAIPSEQHTNVSSAMTLPETEDKFNNVFEEESSETDGLEDEVEVVSYPVPSDDDNAEYYEDMYDEKVFSTPANNSDHEALLFAARQGAAAVLRENASLTQNLRSTRKQLVIYMFVTIALACLCAVMIFAFAYYPKTVYIPTKDNRAICEVRPQDNPNINDITIQEFAKDGVLNLYSIDYANYKTQVDNTLGKWFTPQGRIDTIKAMTDSGILETVDKNALSIKASALSTSKIETTGISNTGQKYWIVRFPMVIDIYSGSPTPINQQKHLVTIRVVADNATALNPQGLGITSVTLSPLAN